jgi:hypothetical protein
VSRPWIATAVVFVVFVLVDLAIGVDIPNLTGVFAFAGCIALIYGSKWLGKKVLYRGEDYYGEDTAKAAGEPSLDRSGHGEEVDRA